MTEKEKQEYFRDNLVILGIGVLILCISILAVYFDAISSHIDYHVLNDCTKEIVGNCFVK